MVTAALESGGADANAGHPHLQIQGTPHGGIKSQNHVHDSKALKAATYCRDLRNNNKSRINWRWYCRSIIVSAITQWTPFDHHTKRDF